MFKKFEIKRAFGGRRYDDKPAVRFFFPGEKIKSKPGVKGGGCTTLYLRGDVARSLRWIAGDLVDFYWDEDSRRVGVKRSAGGIAKICVPHQGKQHHVHVNREIADKIESSWGKQSDDGYSVIASYEILEDMLVLSYERIV